MDILKIKDLKTYFFIKGKDLPAVDGVSFNLKRKEILAVIGESGSGKSMLSLSILNLIDKPGKIINGEILFLNEKSINSEGDYTDLTTLKDKKMRKIRGKEIAMIYQDPMSTLNPYMSIGAQLSEGLRVHMGLRRKDAKNKAINLMEKVGIDIAEKRYDSLPKAFSGGMRQRVMIAMAISCSPKILLADEPTTALDVTIQKDILNLLYNLREEEDMAIVINTHDLGVVKEVADNVIVMYCGMIMEKTSKENLFKNPLNPYTKGLIKSMPKARGTKERLYNIRGSVPDPVDFPKGCRFNNRCPYAFSKCMKSVPPLIEVEKDHYVRCFLFENEEEK